MKIRKQLLNLIVLEDELQYFHHALNTETDCFKKFRLIKQNLISLNTFLETIRSFNEYLKDNEQLKSKTRSIRKRGGLINHMRNKIGGHLDENLLYRAAQWTPIIFSKISKENRELQVGLAYKTIIEASINSYIDLSDNEIQKEFGTEIDLSYSPDTTLFYNYLGNLNLDSIDWISSIIEIVEKDFQYFDNIETSHQSKIAGFTDFNLKNEFKLPENQLLEENELVKFTEKIFQETDNTRKKEGLQELIKLLGKKIKSS
jgi:hypothetical protein